MMCIAFDREIERSAQIDIFKMRRRDAPQVAGPNGLSTRIWSTARCMWIVFHAITALESRASAEDTAASESLCLVSSSGTLAHRVVGRLQNPAAQHR